MQIKLCNYAQRVYELTNQFRLRAGFNPLSLNLRLCQAAQKHSEEMAKFNYLSHTGYYGSTLISRIQAVHYQFSYLAENIGWNYQTPERALKGWINSHGHYKNLINPNFLEIGIGYSGAFCTQVFGRK